MSLLKPLRIDKIDIPPSSISEEEIIVRGIITPLFYSKSKDKLKETAFLPPPRDKRKDVSVLRHDYTDTHFCKNHCAQLAVPDNVYCGMAVFRANSIEEVNSGNYTSKEGERISVSLKATPILNDKLTLPMHADIIYSHSIDYPDGEPRTLCRLIAKQILKRSKFYTDPFPNEPNWRGDTIVEI